MAKGDVVSDIQALSHGYSLVFQPAAGVEVLIEYLGLEASTSIFANFTNGVTVCLIGNGFYMTLIERKRIFLNNTNYLSIVNAAGATQPVGYSGIQTK